MTIYGWKSEYMMKIHNVISIIYLQHIIIYNNVLTLIIVKSDL